MRTLSKSISILPLVALFACSTTTEESRMRAVETEAKVKSYRIEQQNRVDRINREYRAASTEAIRALSTLVPIGRSLQKSSEEQTLADLILIDWEKQTLPSAIAGSFEKQRERNIESFQRTEKALADARQQYVEAYRPAVIQLAKLERIEEHLRSLAEKDATPIIIKEFARFAILLLEKKIQAQSTSS